jgi:hypothetical protein
MTAATGRTVDTVAMIVRGACRVLVLRAWQRGVRFLDT